MKAITILAGFYLLAFSNSLVAGEPADGARVKSVVQALQTANKVFLEAVDAETGKPFADAPVIVRLFHPGGHRVLSLKTDGQGCCTIEIPAGLPIVAVVVESKPAGRVPVHYRWDHDPPSVKVPERLTFHFRPGTVIGGRVVDESGRPVADAKVEVLIPATQSKVPAHYFFHAATVATDTVGRWRCDTVPADLAGLWICFGHADFLPGQASLDSLVEPAKSVLEKGLLAEAHVVRLEQGVTLTGRVLGPDGKPVTGARAAFGRGPMECSHEPETKTDPRGRFELQNCRKGPSAVTVQADGFAPQMIKLAVGPEAKPLEFRLQPATTLRLRAVDPSGKPLVGVSFLAYEWPAGGSPSFHAIRFHASTDAEGRVAWSSAPSDPVIFHVRKTGYRTNFRQIVTASPQEQVVTLYPEPVIQGAVTDAETGTPVVRQ
jgi:hypothetical protein